MLVVKESIPAFILWKFYAPYKRQISIEGQQREKSIKKAGNYRKRYLYAAHNATDSLTILSWEHNGNGAERSLAFGVVGTHFDAKWRKGQDALIPVHVTGLSRYGRDGVRPVDFPQWPESDDVAKTISIL